MYSFFKCFVLSKWIDSLPLSFGSVCCPHRPLCRETRRSWFCAPGSPSWSNDERTVVFVVLEKNCNMQIFSCKIICKDHILTHTCFLNSWHSSGVRVSALAMRGITLTLSWRRFINSISRGFSLKKKRFRIQVNLSNSLHLFSC